MYFLVVFLALFAAFLFAAAAALQQRAARAAAEPEETSRAGRTAVLRPLLRLMRRLLGTRLWLFGWLVNVFGFLGQAAALHFGSVALVQPVLVTQLLFALPFAAVGTHRRPTRLAWTSGILICGGVALFLSTRGLEVLEGQPRRDLVFIAGGVLIVLVAALVVISTGRGRLMHATILAVAAGLCFTASSVLTKLTTDDLLGRGIAHTATDWPGYTLAASTACGMLLEQGAFARGSLPAAVAGMSITNPVASYVVGVFVTGMLPPVNAEAIATLVVAAVLTAAGVIGLSRTPSIKPGGGGEDTSGGGDFAPDDARGDEPDPDHVRRVI